MNRIMARFLFPILAVTGVALLSAQPAVCETITATLVRVDAQGITVQTSDGMQKQYPLRADIRVPANATPGTKVHLTLDENYDGIQQVTFIQTDTATSSLAADGDRDQLPATASQEWLLGAIGLLSLLGVVAVRRYRRLQDRRHRVLRLRLGDGR